MNFDHQSEFEFIRNVNFSRKSKSTKLLPLGRIGNFFIWIIPKDYSLFGRLDFQGIHEDS